MGEIGVKGEVQVFLPDGLHSEIQLDSLVRDLSDIVPVARESGGARQGDIVDEVVRKLVVIAEFHICPVLPHRELESCVKLVRDFPAEGGVAHRHQGYSESGLVPFVRVHVVCGECGISREINLSGPSVCHPDAQERYRSGFEGLVLVYVESGSGSPERGELVVLSECRVAVQPARCVEEVYVLVAVVHTCEESYRTGKALGCRRLACDFLGIVDGVESARRESEIGRVFGLALVVEDVDTGLSVDIVVIEGPVVGNVGAEIPRQPVGTGLVQCSGGRVGKSEKFGVLLGPRVEESVGPGQSLGDADLAVQPEAVDDVPVQGEIVHELLVPGLVVVPEPGLVERVLADRGVDTPVPQGLEVVPAGIKIFVVWLRLRIVRESPVRGFPGIGLQERGVVLD